MVNLKDEVFTFRIQHLVLLFIILFTGTVALGGSALFYDHHMQNCPAFTGDNKFIWLPTAVSEHFEGDSVALHFSTLQGNKFTVYGTVWENAIYPLSCKEKENLDFEVSMSDWNALTLATSLKPTETFVKLWRMGEITIAPHGEENEQKLEAADELIEQDEPVPEAIRNIFLPYLE